MTKGENKFDKGRVILDQLLEERGVGDCPSSHPPLFFAARSCLQVLQRAKTKESSARADDSFQFASKIVQAISPRKNYFTLLFTTFANSNIEIWLLPPKSGFSFPSALIILLFFES